MAATKESLFRQEALERITSPERLDHLLRVTSSRDWLALTALAVLAAVGGVWSVWGTLPETAIGKGVLTYPRTMQPLDAPGEGRLRSLTVRPGDMLQRGQMIARLERPEVDRESTALGNRLAELERQNLAMQKIESDRTALELQEIQVSIATLDLRVQAQQRAIGDAETLSPILEKRLATERTLRKEGLTPAVSNAAIEAEQAYLQNESRLKELRADISRGDFERAQLETSRKRLAQDVLQRVSARRNEIDALRAQQEVLDARTDAIGVVRSEHEGRVVELLMSEGQLVTTGARIALIETAGRSPALTCLAYLPIRDGKRVRSGMAVQVTPDMVSRERFGGILGTVESVSTFPVTREAVAVTVGSRDVAEHITTAEPHIEMVIALASDPTTASGYRWSSSTGPPLNLSAGTTTAIRVTVEERAPITFLLPFLRSLTGVY